MSIFSIFKVIKKNTRAMSINASVIFLLLTLTIIFASGKFVQIMVTIRSTLSQMVSMFKVRNKNTRFSAAYVPS